MKEGGGEKERKKEEVEDTEISRKDNQKERKRYWKR